MAGFECRDFFPGFAAGLDPGDRLKSSTRGKGRRLEKPLKQEKGADTGRRTCSPPYEAMRGHMPVPGTFYFYKPNVIFTG